MEAWQKLVYSTPESTEQILDEIIWNRFIKINGSSVYYKQWHEAGITKVSDILKGNSFLTFNDFVSTFQLKTNFLKYCGLCHAITQEWINLLKGKSGPITSSIKLITITKFLQTKFHAKEIRKTYSREEDETS